MSFSRNLPGQPAKLRGRAKSSARSQVSLWLSMACAMLAGTSGNARELGKIVFIGDSITQASSISGAPLFSQNGTRSYRWEVFKRLVDSGDNFDFVGSLRTNYNTGTGLDDALNSPYRTWRGVPFPRAHEGHYGWRAFQISGDSVGPDSGRRGFGNILTWTNPKLGGYVADQAAILIGINDITGSAQSPAQVQASVVKTLTALRAANPNVTIHLMPLLHLASGHSAYVSGNTAVDTYNAALPEFAATNSTPTSRILVVDWTPPVRNASDVWVAQQGGWNPEDMTYDRVHPNSRGEALMGQQLAKSLGAASKWTSVNINNASFDGAATNENTATCAPEGWTIYGTANPSAIPRLVTDYSMINESTVDIATSGIGDSGKAYIIAGSADTGIKQTLAETLAPERHYMLQVDLAKGSSALTAGDFAVEVWAGSTKLGEANNRVVPKLYTTGTGAIIGSKLTEALVEFTSRDFPASIGQPIEIRLISRNSTRYIGFENVRLSWKNDPAPAPKHYKVYVLTGQSNSLGTTNGREIDKTAGHDLADANIPFFWHNVPDATQSLGSSNSFFRPLQTQQGNYFYATSETHWGPEINFARSLWHAGERDFVMIKASRGGGGNTNWDKASSGHMYTQVVDTVTQACQRLTKDGHTFEIKGLLYLQGESNTAAEAAIAGDRFKALVDNLRADLPNATALKGFMVGNADSSADDATTRTRQEAIAAAYPEYLSYTDSYDVRPWLVPNDNLHHNKQAKLMNGARFADAVLGKIASYSASSGHSSLFGTQYGNSAGGTNGTNNTDTTSVTGLTSNLEGANPILQGWFESKSAVPAPATDQHAATTTDNGSSAWQINDSSTTGTGYLYSRRLTSTQASSLLNSGWSYRQQISFPAGFATAPGYLLSFVSPARHWRVELGRDSANNLQARFFNGTTSTTQTILAGYQGQQVSVELRCAAGANTASLMLDGQNVATITAETTSAGLDTGAHFGTFDAAAQATVNVFSSNLGVPVELSTSAATWQPAHSASSTQLDISSNASWSASSSASWLTASPPSATGNAQLTLSAAANPLAAQRQATVTLSAPGANDVTVTVTQAPAPATLSTNSSSWNPQSGASSTAIAVTSNASWSASSSASWLTASPASATGNGQLTLSAAANPLAAQRQATVTLSAPGATDVTVTVTQAPAPATLSTNSSSWNPQSGAASTAIAVTSNASWSASSSAPWLTASPASATGNAQLSLSAAANPLAAQRQATVTLSAPGATDVTVTVTQAPAPATLSTNSSSWNPQSGAASTAIAVTSNASWSASSSASWLTASPASATGNAQLSLSAAANPLAAQRQATVTLSAPGAPSASVVVTQAAATATLEVSPQNWTAPSPAATHAVSISCNADWSASSSASWLTLSRTSGSPADSQLSLSVSQNSTPDARSASVTITSGALSRLVSVTQTTSGVLEVSQTAWNPVNPDGDQLAITVQASDVWQLSGLPDWVSASPASGAPGQTPVTLTAKSNQLDSSRSASLTFSSGDLARSLTIVQPSANERLSVDIDSLDFSELAQTATVNVRASGNWVAFSNSASWLTPAKPSGSGNAPLTIKVTANTSNQPRSGEITVFCEKANRLVTISVSQRAPASDAALSLSSTSLNLPAKASTKKITLKATSSWQLASPLPDWLTLNSTSGSANSTLILTASHNPDAEARSAILVFSCGDISVPLNVLQAANSAKLFVREPGISSPVTALARPSSAGSLTLDVVSATPWSTTSTLPEWLTASNSNGQLVLNWSANSSGKPRSASVTLTSGSAKSVFKLTQQATESPELVLSPVNWKASNKASNRLVKVKSNAPWSVRVTAGSDWLTLADRTSTSFTLANSDNSRAARIGEVLVTSGQTTRTFLVYQAGLGDSVSVNPSSWFAPVNGATKSLAIISNASWTCSASGKQSWLTIADTPAYTHGNGLLKITAAPNDTGKQRSASVTIVAGKKKTVLKVTQEAYAASLTVTPNSAIAFPTSSANITLQVTANTKWKVVSSLPKWLTAKGAGSGTASAPVTSPLVISAKANSSNLSRSAVVTVSAGSQTVDILVTQAGTASPVTAPNGETPAPVPSPSPDSSTPAPAIPGQATPIPGRPASGADSNSSAVVLPSDPDTLVLPASAQTVKLPVLADGLVWEADAASSWVAIIVVNSENWLVTLANDAPRDRHSTLKVAPASGNDTIPAPRQIEVIQLSPDATPLTDAVWMGGH